MSPWPRTIFSLILNPVSNALTRHRRPDHQHHRNLTPVAPLPGAFRSEPDTVTTAGDGVS